MAQEQLRVGRIPGLPRWRSWLLLRVAFPETRRLAEQADIPGLLGRLEAVREVPGRFSERAVIAHLLGRLRATAAVPYLAQLATDGRGDVRLAAAGALVEIGTDAADELLAREVNNANVWVRLWALEAIQRQAPVLRDVPALSAVLIDDNSRLARMNAAVALRDAEDPRSVAALREAVAGGGLETAWAAAISLRRRGDDDAYTALNQLVASAPTRVRRILARFNRFWAKARPVR